jgi:hypothetical protein
VVCTIAKEELATTLDGRLSDTESVFGLKVTMSRKAEK